MDRKLGLDVLTLVDGPIATAIPWTEEIEAAGYDRVWVGDSPGLGWADPYLSLGAMAAATTRLGLGTGVTNPRTRHWSAAAGAMISLHELSAGRALYGVGLGYSAVKAVGLPPAKLADLRDHITHFRAATEKAGVSIPVVVAASGPRAMQLAGAVGDGVLLSVGTDPALIRQARSMIELGAREAGRSIDDIEVLALSGIAIDEDWAAAKAEAAPAAARRAVDVLKNPDALPPELSYLVAAARSTGEAYDVHKHTDPGETESNRRVSDDLVRAYTIVGDAQACVDRVGKMHHEGVDTVVLYPVGRRRREMVTKFTAEVLPGLASLGR